MKKIFLTFMVLIMLLLVGCVNNKSDIMNEKETTNDEIVIDGKTISYEEGVYPWEENVITYNEVCIKDIDSAIRVASIIVENFQKQGFFENYVPQTAFFDTKDKIWIISFWENRDIYSDGADFSIAIKAENAQVVKMWCGE